MPDLVTHTAAAWAFVRFFKPPHVRVVFYLGSLLPDVLSRPLYILFPSLTTATVATHTPFFVIVACFLIAEAFQHSLRHQIRTALLLGSALHFVLDAMQRHIGTSYFWFFPFSWSSPELGWFWPETPLEYIPVWVSVIGVTEIMLFSYKRFRVRDHSP
jgi:RsiW-degrading membrane proteinase PrsW (M82 family)